MVATVPSVVGTLPTMTKPPLRPTGAVLNPGRLLVKNVTALPGGAIVPVGLNCPIVAPVPCTPVTGTVSVLLKLLTSTSPAAMIPPPGKCSGTNATPYGLTSPLPGTVEELINCGMNGSAALAGVPKVTLKLAASRALRATHTIVCVIFMAVPRLLIG